MGAMVYVQNFRFRHAAEVWLWKLPQMWSTCLQLLCRFTTGCHKCGVRYDGEGPACASEEDKLGAPSRNGAGVPVVGRAPVESRQIEDPPFSVPPHRAGIVPVAQASSSLDGGADDERLLSVPEDVVNALESDLAVQSAGSPQSIQDVVERDDADEESGAVVNHFDMTVADSDQAFEVTPRHHLAHNPPESTASQRTDLRH